MDIRNPKEWKKMGIRGCRCRCPERGASIVELAFILPILVILVLGIVDIGRLIQARLVVTNMSREGGSLASRVGLYDDVANPGDDRQKFATIMNLLLSSSAPLDLKGAEGRIYITRINAGFTEKDPNPWIYIKSFGGSMAAVTSSITGGEGDEAKGLSDTLQDHLTYQKKNKDADIDNLTVVEVYYLYRPITPLPTFMKDLILPGKEGLLIGSSSYF